MADLTEIDALLARVPEGTTPGPWETFIDDSGGQWSGWPLSVEATRDTDKTVVRTGGQWPYEWDAKTSQHEACANAALIALAPDLVTALRALRAEVERQSATISDLTRERDAAREALSSMCGAFDTPIARRRISNDFADEARRRARAALSTTKGGADASGQPAGDQP